MILKSQILSSLKSSLPLNLHSGMDGHLMNVASRVMRCGSAPNLRPTEPECIRLYVACLNSPRRLLPCPSQLLAKAAAGQTDSACAECRWCYLVLLSLDAMPAPAYLSPLSFPFFLSLSKFPRIIASCRVS
uniref:PPUP9577 n=1 Tax=Poeciliopsis prolifica TaxID=188132 RepID=A0A0S7ENP5_9TELE